MYVLDLIYCTLREKQKAMKKNEAEEDRKKTCLLLLKSCWKVSYTKLKEALFCKFGHPYKTGMHLKNVLEN